MIYVYMYNDVDEWRVKISLETRQDFQMEGNKVATLSLSNLAEKCGPIENSGDSVCNNLDPWLPSCLRAAILASHCSSATSASAQHFLPTTPSPL